MKNQDLFSSKDKRKKIKMSSAVIFVWHFKGLYCCMPVAVIAHAVWSDQKLCLPSSSYRPRNTVRLVGKKTGVILHKEDSLLK